MSDDLSLSRRNAVFLGLGTAALTVWEKWRDSKNASAEMDYWIGVVSAGAKREAALEKKLEDCATAR